MRKQIPPPKLRTETRFAVAASDQLSLRLETQQPERAVAGRVIECSARGLACQAPSIPEGTAVRAVISADHLSLRQEVTGVVRWCRLSGKDWRHGIEFDHELPSGFISKLLEAGVLDRRQDPRAVIELPARIRSELSGGSSMDVLVVDFSAGGLRIQSDAPLKLENRLLLDGEKSQVPQAEAIQLRPMWQQERDGKFVTGCCFLDASGVNVLRTWLQSEPISQQPSVEASRRAWFWLSVAASLGVVAAGIMSIL